MADGIEIINGGRVNEEPIGKLTDADGKTILVWRDNVADAFLQAVLALFHNRLPLDLADDSKSLGLIHEGSLRDMFTMDQEMNSINKR